MTLPKYIFLFMIISFVDTVVAASVASPRDRACAAKKVGSTILQSMAWEATCGLPKSSVVEDICNKGNPYPSNDDIWKNCVACVLNDNCDENWGEPHLVTRDGLRYDFQAQGDYALVVSDGLEVQARYKKFSSGTSILNGVAIKKGDDLVIVENDSKYILVNGKNIEMSSGDWHEIGTTRSYVQKIGEGVIVRLDGTLTLSIVGRILTIDLNEKYAGKTQGLNGNGDGDPENDLRTANGTPVDATDPSSLYGQYMLDWRREGKASLFPTPFQYIGDPNAISQEAMGLSDIDPAKRRNAYEKCRAAGLKSGAGLDECTYDLAITGDDSFIDDALFVADSLKSTISAEALTTQDISVFSLENEASVSPGMPGKGAGELERSSNLDRYTLRTSEDAQPFVQLHTPCDSSIVSLVTLLRQAGKLLNELPLRCGQLMAIPNGEIDIDVFSPAGDVVEYSFDIVDADGTNIGLQRLEYEVEITAPEEATAGTEVELSWEAPPQGLDGLINIQLLSEEPNNHADPYIYTKEKSSSSFRLPSVAGEYVLRWYNRNDRQLLAERPITLTAAAVSITAPEEATAGTAVELSWEAPQGLDAFINIQLRSEEPNNHAGPYIYTKEKSSSSFRMPSVAGEYVLRWYNRNDRQLLAERSITLTAAAVSITAPEEAIAGTAVELSWEAPQGLDAFINIQLRSEEPNNHADPYIYTKEKSSSSFRMPSVAGEYVLRWYNRNDRQLLAERPITLTAAAVSITAPEEATAGTAVELSWEAPQGLDAFINIQLRSEEPNNHAGPYIYTKEKSSSSFRMPSVAGEYVLRWYNRNDRQLLAERSITLTAAAVSITAPEEAIAGTAVELSWEAPQGLDAFINIQLRSEEPNYHADPYIYTKEKSSGSFRMPSVAGEYVLRWYNRNDRQLLAERSITLTAAAVSITAPEEATAGTEVELSWEAPQGLDAFINIQLRSEEPNYHADPYIYTKEKSSGSFRMPSVAGEYVLRWYNRNDRQLLAERPITLTAAEETE